MSIKKDVVNLVVNINGDAGKKELNNLRSRAAQLKSEMANLKKGTGDWITKSKELSTINARMDELRKSMGLTSLSQKELINELKKLQQIKLNLTPQSKEFNALQKQIEAVQNRLKEVRTGKFGINAFFANIKDEVKQFGMLAAGYLGFDFIVGQAKNIIGLQAKLSREYADILKTTSLTTDQVKELDDELRKLDTPTSNSRLRKLAAEAGKLGIDGVENIKKFVNEADKIEVALGEDLGEEGLMKVAKLSGIFKEGMLNIASGINAVGQASAASEPYQVDFAFRLAGTAQTAKISAGDLLGYAAALEVNGQTAEVAGTAMSTFFLDFIKNADNFGKSIGMAHGELGKLINEKGVNEAFLTWLKTIKDSTHSTDEFIQKMNKLGIDGARGAGAFLVLAENIEQVRQQQLIANDAIQEGTSVLDEFEVRNQSFDAVVKRIEKTFNAFFTSDTINKGVKQLVYWLEDLLKAIKVTFEFIDKNRIAVIAWGAAIILQTGIIKKRIASISLMITGIEGATLAQVKNILATKADIIITTSAGVAKALFAGNIRKVKQEMQLLTATLGTNPWTALLLIIGALIVAFNSLSSVQDKMTAKMRVQESIDKAIISQTSEKISRINELTKVINDATISENKRNAALKELISLDPEVLKGLDLKNMATAEGKKILNQYIDSLKEAAKAEALYAMVRQKTARNQEIDIESNTLKKGLWGDKYTGMGGAVTQYFDQILETFGWDNDLSKYNKLRKERAKNEEDIAEAQKLINDNKILPIINTDTTDLYGGGGNNDDKNKGGKNAENDKRNFLERLKQLQLEVETLEAKHSENLDKIEASEIASIQAKYAKLFEEAKKYAIDTAEIEILKSKELDILIENQTKRREEKKYDEQLKALNNYHQSEILNVQEQYAKGLTTAKEYEEALLLIELNSIQDRQQLASNYSEWIEKAKVDEEKAKTEAVKYGVEERKRLEAIEQQNAELYHRNRIAIAKRNVLTAQANSIEELEAKKALLEAEVSNTQLTADEKLAIQEEYYAKLTNLQNDWLKNLASEIEKYVQLFQDAMNSFFTYLNNKDAEDLNREKESNGKKSEYYTQLLEKKKISQTEYDNLISELNEKQEAKEKEANIKKAKRDKASALFEAAINTASAIIEALPNIPLSIAVGVAGGIQTGLIAATPLPKAKKGMILNGASHEQGGINLVDGNTGKPLVEAEGGEPLMVLSKNTYKNNKSLIDELIYNSNHKNGAQVSASQWYMRRVQPINREVLPLMQQGGVIENRRSIVNDQQVRANTESSRILHELIIEQRKTRDLMKKLNNQPKRNYVTLNDIDTTSKLRDRIRKISGIKQ